MMRQRIIALLFIILTFALSTGMVLAQEATEAAEEGGWQGIGLLLFIIGIGAIFAVGVASYRNSSSDTSEG